MGNEIHIIKCVNETRKRNCAIYMLVFINKKYVKRIFQYTELVIVFRSPLYGKTCDTIELIQCISANTLHYIVYLVNEKTKYIYIYIYISK